MLMIVKKFLIIAIIIQLIPKFNQTVKAIDTPIYYEYVGPNEDSYAVKTIKGIDSKDAMMRRILILSVVKKNL